ncbi:MAG: hypothetical protein F6K17_10620 [Okeania sp. SIO3C4]|nr:hypothetical protein [Okeania sp. SIO3B3]NER03044.1 hypothetical protein [Okeania sp. SIO3C4]
MKMLVAFHPGSIGSIDSKDAIAGKNLYVYGASQDEYVSGIAPGENP